MNRTTMITALACGLLLSTGVAAQVGPDSIATSAGDLSGTDSSAGDTLLVNGRAYTLE